MNRQHRINREITHAQVRVISASGDQMGIMTITEALRKAEEHDVDLVEFAPKAVPPVCKIIDYGKFLYQIQKSTVKQKTFELKEIQLRVTIDDGDYKVKLRKAQEFLNEGHKVKLSLRFKGREIIHKELGYELFTRFQTDSAGIVETHPRLEGKQMLMIIAPNKK